MDKVSHDYNIRVLSKLSSAAADGGEISEEGQDSSAAEGWAGVCGLVVRNCGVE